MPAYTNSGYGRIQRIQQHETLPCRQAMISWPIAAHRPIDLRWRTAAARRQTAHGQRWATTCLLVECLGVRRVSAGIETPPVVNQP
jgi:hypothetical protein